jgi:hypothetical protein
VEAWIIQCLLQLANVTPEFVAVESDSDDSSKLKIVDSKNTKMSAKEVNKLWEPIWNLLLKKLSYFHPSVLEKGLLVLKSMIQNDIVDNTIVKASQDRMWKLSVFDDPTKLTACALEFLLAFIQKYEPHEETQTIKDNNNVSQTRREKLIRGIFEYLGQVKIHSFICFSFVLLF